LFFDVLLHMGTLVAVFIVYRKDIKEMCRATLSLFTGNRGTEDHPIKRSKARLAFMIIIGTLPMALALPIHNMIGSLGNRMWFVGLMLLITGGLLYCSDKLKKGKRTEKNMTMRSALTVGLLQGTIGLLPGISRSGITITTGMMTGLERGFAVRFSFLLSIPAILGANIVVLFSSMSDVDWSLLPRYLVGVLVAGVTGFFAIKLVKLIVDAGRFGKFAYYCWFVGIIAIVASIVMAVTG